MDVEMILPGAYNPTNHPELIEAPTKGTLSKKQRDFEPKKCSLID
jgi:hypothetical protein